MYSKMSAKYQKVEISDVTGKINELTRAMAIFNITKISSKTYPSSDSESCCNKGSESDSSVDFKITDQINNATVSETLEQKINYITALLKEQNELMLSIKKEVSRSNIAVQHTVDTHTKLASELLEIATDERNSKDCEKLTVAENASILMAGLGVKHKTLDNDDTKMALEQILYSESYKEQLTQCFATAINNVLDSSLLKKLSACYISDLKKCKVVKDITKVLDVAFRKLETNAAIFAQESSRASRSMRMALDRHLRAMETANTLENDLTAIIQDTIYDVIEDEMSKWREDINEAYAEVRLLIANAPHGYKPHAKPMVVERSTPAVEEMRQAVIIDGELNRSFELALTELNVNVVLEACRTYNPDIVFGPPCHLNQNVLLSLIQQLSTDMNQETEMKCRYIEGSIMSLKENDAVTRAHVANVFRDAIRHLKGFLTLDPMNSHARRLKMIIMAADSFLMKVYY